MNSIHDEGDAECNFPGPQDPAITQFCFGTTNKHTEFLQSWLALKVFRIKEMG